MNSALLTLCFVPIMGQKWFKATCQKETLDEIRSPSSDSLYMYEGVRINWHF